MSATELRTGDLTILVVDDDPDHRLLIRLRLEATGVGTIEEAASAEEARAVAATTPPDLVLLDLRLPDADGLALLEELSRTDAAVVVVTAADQAEVAVDALRAGAADFITKHPGYLDLLPQVIERARLHRDLRRRARELQRLVLLLPTRSERAALFAEVCRGAQLLLAGRGAALLLDEGAGLRVAAASGDIDTDPVRPATPDTLPPGDVQVEGTQLRAALLVEEDEPYGVLVVGRERAGWLEEERELARTFAAFAGMAVRQLRRRELERALVEELQRTVRARRDLIASLSHELRTPLTSVLGYTELLRRRLEQVSADQLDTFLARIEVNARALYEQLQRLLDLGDLERGWVAHVDLQRVGLETAVAQVCTELAGLLDGRTIRVEVGAAEVVADPRLLRRVLADLVSNAVKFSPAHTPVEIVAVPAGGGRVRVSVTDHGIGLDPAEAARVFDAFWRAPAAVEGAVRGAGVGLSLVRAYVRAMGGTVGVVSRPGQGSTFWFELPGRVGERVDGEAAAGGGRPVPPAVDRPGQ